jgi:hypothetical protein
MTAPKPRLVHGLAGVPLDAYDALDLLAERTDDEPAQILTATARVVADLWNDPPWSCVQRDQVRRHFPELADALDELLGGGPMTPPITLADCRVQDGA